MRIVADENVEKEIVDRLRANGHDVVFIAEAAPGIDDDAVLDRSVNAGRILLLRIKISANWFFGNGWRTREYF